ncbi:MAG: DUF3426 domain-containing protein [Rhodospirillaceae bacterium]|jgi:predicted Zn finger-like uncharacterized protein|nr:DUF3426 domain-containing protein [Rhodospirillaceae bacterium]
MRITCPNCTAGFEIPTELLGRKGRSVKCATCGHSWFQAAVIDEIGLVDVLAEPESASITQAVAAAANAAMEQGIVAGAPIAPPQGAGGSDQGQQGIANAPQAMDGGAQCGRGAAPRAAAGAANAMPSGALPAGAEPGAAGGPGAAGEEARSLLSGQTAGPVAPGGPGPEGGPGQAGGDSGGSVAGAGDEDGLDDDQLGENGDDEFDEEDLGKPTPDKKKPKKPLDPAYVTAAVMLIIALLFGSILFVARAQLAELWPGIKGGYEALYLDDDQAEGLRLSQPQPARIMQAGVQTLVVTGLVTNLTDGLQTVPNLKLMLIDKDDNVVQETSAPPTAPTIDPNSTQPYRIELQLQLPVETAASLRVDWD